MKNSLSQSRPTGTVRPISSERERLMQKYPYIRAWGQLMGSHGYYIINECEKAERENAPLNAFHRNDDGTWATYDNAHERVQAELDAYRDGTKGGAIINF